MTVYKTQDNKIKINLTNTEVLTCFGTYEKLNNANSCAKIAINALLRDIIIQHKNLLKGEKIIAKISARKPLGCEITLYSPQNEENPIKEYVLNFADSELLTQAILQLYRNSQNRKIKSWLYSINNKFSLIVKCAKQAFIFEIDGLFKNISSSPVCAEYTREHGKLLIAENAILHYGKAFTKT